MDNYDDIIAEIKSLRAEVGEDKYDKRQEDFEKWIIGFKNSQFKLLFSFANKKGADNVELSDKTLSILLNFHYWSMTERFVRKHINSSHDVTDGTIPRVQHYKIAAVTEYVICNLQPFSTEKDVVSKMVNAAFARHVMLNIIFVWNKEAVKKEELTNRRDNIELQKFLREHTVWLENFCSANQYAIFSNSQTLRLFHYWLKDPLHTHSFDEFAIAD